MADEWQTLLRIQHGLDAHPGLLFLHLPRYQSRKESYHGPNGDVALEVSYDPAHTYDIDDMLASSRAGLDYYQRVYSPYQFSQYRIFEFPRYRTFAESSPTPFHIPKASASSAA